MKFKKREEIKNLHHIVEYNGAEIHRKEKLLYDFKLNVWIRQHLIWEYRYSKVDDANTKLNLNLPTSKQLEREYQLMLLGIK